MRRVSSGNFHSGEFSIESPLGKAVYGKKLGDRVLVPVGDGGGYYVEIREIKNTGDDGSDTIRSY